MIDVSIVGTVCNSFTQCLNIVEQDRNINYQGPNSIDFSERNDPRSGRVGTFTFDAGPGYSPSGRWSRTSGGRAALGATSVGGRGEGGADVGEVADVEAAELAIQRRRLSKRIV